MNTKIAKVIYGLFALLLLCLPAVAQDNTHLTAGINSGSSSAAVASTSSWPNSTYVVQIGNEVMLATKITSTSMNIVRAQGGTTAASHPALSTVKILWSPGSVFFGKASGRFGESNAQLYWDDTLKRLKLYDKNFVSVLGANTTSLLSLGSNDHNQSTYGTLLVPTGSFLGIDQDLKIYASGSGEYYVGQRNFFRVGGPHTSATLIGVWTELDNRTSDGSSGAELIATESSVQSEGNSVSAIAVRGTAYKGNINSNQVFKGVVGIAGFGYDANTSVTGGEFQARSVNTGFITSVADARAVHALVNILTADATVTRAKGLALEGWSNVSSTVTTSYGIYADPTIDIGTTRWFINSTSTSPSMVSGRWESRLTTEQFRAAYDASNYFSTTVGSTGSTTFALTGTSPTFSFSQKGTFTGGAFDSAGVVYGAGWNGSLRYATQDDVYDKIETLTAGSCGVGCVDQTNTQTISGLKTFTNAGGVKSNKFTGVTPCTDCSPADLNILAPDAVAGGGGGAQGADINVYSGNGAGEGNRGGDAFFGTGDGTTGGSSFDGGDGGQLFVVGGRGGTTGTYAGSRGGPGGLVAIQGGDGGSAGATFTFGNGGSVFLQPGQKGGGGGSGGTNGKILLLDAAVSCCNPSFFTGVSLDLSGITGSRTFTFPDVTGTATLTTATQTLTNKRVTPRVTSTASSATPTPSADNDDLYVLTALATNPTFAVPSGTPTDGQLLLVRIKDNGTGRTVAWNAIYRNIATLPLSTTANKTVYVTLRYNSLDTKWDCVAAVSEP